MKAGEVVLITGATGGIGSEIARQAAATGATVAVHGSRGETVQALIDRLKDECPGAQLMAVPADFDQPNAMEKAIASVADRAGRLDAVIHCATSGKGGKGITGPFATTDPERYTQLVDNGLARFQRLCAASLPFLARQGGTIIAFTSDAGRFAAPRQSLVAATAGGVMTFIRNLAMEVARDGVRVHGIAPTFVRDTPVFEALAQAGRAETAQKRAGLGLPAPGDIAPIVVFLCGEGAARITGQIISINGGLNA
ncbi:SDR family NAD(P)-dependent oxidoreductase [Novosphingobium pentaromativorans]|uniref:Short-chain dehydrogenase/reductase SDR n=1 Tax=Novosphingobium pentaromativorans US6-1 TaxID=1088721 RepID=G6E844_9SPHN|nr:SDR family oxidoreductase [Novosphingobium pentaromativorans]AIT81449.1 hypothetical protein JI59_17525 [Novosphingobium pentaromativorans US6-1]EHJ62384.1 hypothetical protein NSU_0515 [Novosphingobium pentaromativorans US6-1]